MTDVWNKMCHDFNSKISHRSLKIRGRSDLCVSEMHSEFTGSLQLHFQIS